MTQRFLKLLRVSMVKERCDKEKQYVFLMNFSRDSREICGETLKGYEVKILEKYL